MRFGGFVKRLPASSKSGEGVPMYIGSRRRISKGQDYAEMSSALLPLVRRVNCGIMR